MLTVQVPTSTCFSILPSYPQLNVEDKEGNPKAFGLCLNLSGTFVPTAPGYLKQETKGHQSTCHTLLHNTRTTATDRVAVVSVISLWLWIMKACQLRILLSLRMHYTSNTIRQFNLGSQGSKTRGNKLGNSHGQTIQGHVNCASSCTR